jgi:hypothetical protein
MNSRTKMIKFFIILFTLKQLLNATLPINVEENAPAAAYILFTPPAGWRAADAKMLPPSVKAMAIGKGAAEYPPSINLGTETYQGTLKQYLNRIKEINRAQGIEWKDLGALQTAAGKGSLSQIDKKTEWGEVRMMHFIMSHEGVVYIMTAAALKEEFPRFYNDFFSAFQSLHFQN